MQLNLILFNTVLRNRYTFNMANCMFLHNVTYTRGLKIIRTEMKSDNRTHLNQQSLIRLLQTGRHVKCSGKLSY